MFKTLLILPRCNAVSTTVVNPSLWIAIYNTTKIAALFFVSFLTSTLYFRSIVMSVVFNSFVKAMKTIRGRYLSDREDSLRLAFHALHDFDAFRGEGSNYRCFVPVWVIKRVLQGVRPHYTDTQVRGYSNACSLTLAERDN